MAGVFFHERDPFSPLGYSYEVDQVLYTTKTDYQEIAVLSSQYFGRIMVIDGVVQLTERDEFFYHEMLAHVPLHAHPSPRRVLIIGGGDGGTLREVLKHDSVEEAVVAEIDVGVIETAKRFFPNLASGFSDPRARVCAGDGAEFVAKAKREFDIVLIDSTDPVGPASSLFQLQFYQAIAAALRPDGIMVAQTESLHFHRQLIAQVQKGLAPIFPIVDLYTVPLATYAGNWWTFSIASQGPDPTAPCRPQTVSARYYSAEVHKHAFLPRNLLADVRDGNLPW